MLAEKGKHFLFLPYLGIEREERSTVPACASLGRCRFSKSGGLSFRGGSDRHDGAATDRSAMAAGRSNRADNAGPHRGIELSATGSATVAGCRGEYAGTISGGCLETEVLRKANWLAQEGAVVEHYSTMFDDTAEIPFGLGCGGAVDLLFEPGHTLECRALMSALESAIAGEETTVLTWLPSDGTTVKARCALRRGRLHLRQ